MNGVNILEKQHPSKTSDRQMCDVDFYAAKLGVKFWAPNGKPSVFRRGERFNGNWPEGHRSSFV